ncbi:hypothetical protein CTEN210_07376 [Chaetoceros tenuissimus]|uniref:Uncharacterized protein n=1 Tax=Chaetoceros tenuissimus TaxID=426638 RepID=A0AAD3H594_9STRA|nr:hypothetical protein CTEN210_07376 [Chaetoceros tenuissimus]
MKNFKSHEIDTRAIMRVSDLFRGYNNLILGLNTFLPDGFKISIKELVEGGRYASKKPLPPGVMNHNMSQQMGRGPPQHQQYHPNAQQMNQHHKTIERQFRNSRDKDFMQPQPVRKLGRAQVSIRRDERGDDQEVTIDMTKKHAEKQQMIGKKRPSRPSATLQYPMMPETMIYNAGVERQFFDLAKESLRASSREGDLAWAEFLKCMDLYAQEILSKNDMLRYMEDLLGKHHEDLFEEFKSSCSRSWCTEP